MAFWKPFVIGTLGSVLAFYLCEEVFPLLSTVIVNYPFQSFVVTILTVIMVLLTVVASKQLKSS